MLKNLNIPIYNDLLKENEIFITKITIDKIEDTINTILDKYNEICKYYINYSEFYWSVSFNVDLNQLEEMQKTSFEIKIFKGALDNAVLEITDEIKENLHWNELYLDLKKIKIN